MNADDAVRDFWANRPRRATRDRKIAGVAAGIGHRYGVDPVLVRVAFAVLTFYGGAGVLLYLLGWLLLPNADERISGFEGMTGHTRTSMSTTFAVLLCLAIIPVSGWVFNGFSGLIALALGVGALYLLHRNRSGIITTGGSQSTGGQPAPDTGSLGVGPPLRATFTTQPGTTADLTSTTAPSTTTSMPTTGASTTVPTGPVTPQSPAPIDPLVRTTPPAWDPLGAAPFAWDLPEPRPATPPTQPARRRSPVTPVTMALALLTAGGCVLGHKWVPWLTAAHSLALVLAILGLGLVLGSLVRGGRGLIWPAIPVALSAVALTVVPIGGINLSGGVGDHTYLPGSVDQVHPNYKLGAGTVTLDLTRLPANTPEVHTSIDVGVGDSHVVVPRDADVTVSCTTGIGDANCLGETQSGHVSDMRVSNNGPDGPGGTKIELQVHAGTGDVEVTRG